MLYCLIEMNLVVSCFELFKCLFQLQVKCLFKWIRISIWCIFAYSINNGTWCIHIILWGNIIYCPQIYTDSAEAKIPAVLDYLGTVIEVCFHWLFIYVERFLMSDKHIIWRLIKKLFFFLQEYIISLGKIRIS